MGKRRKQRKARVKRLKGFRKLCPHCKHPIHIKEQDLATLLGQRPSLSPKQRVALDWIIAHTHRGVPPSLTQMADGLGVARNVMKCKLQVMEKKGWIARTKRMQYSLRVIDDAAFRAKNNSIK